MSELDVKSLLEGNQILKNSRGSDGTVCFAAIDCRKGTEPFYWSAENGSAELDFIFQNGCMLFHWK